MLVMECTSMRKKGIYILFILILMVTSSCKIEHNVDYEIIAPQSIEMGDDSLYGFQIKTIDGEIIPIDTSMLASNSVLCFYKEGEQTLVINYKGVEKEIRINVLRRHFENISFDSLTTTFTGQPITINVSGDIPANTNIWYPYGNSFINPGVYNITAVLSSPYYETIELQSTLTIVEADL